MSTKTNFCFTLSGDDSDDDGDDDDDDAVSYTHLTLPTKA